MSTTAKPVRDQPRGREVSLTTASIAVDFDVPTPMRDGVVLRANVYRPAGEGRWPVIVSRLPYGKDLPIGTAVLDPVQAARRGYVVVIQDTRGRFAWDGDWYPFRHEAEDGADTIAWAAALTCSDGRVGTFGASYYGFTQWSAAAEQPPALAAMVPFITWADPLNGLVYRGGALELGAAANWHLRMGLDVLVRRHRGDPQTLVRRFHELVAECDALGNEGYRSLPLNEFAPLRRSGVGQAFFDSLEVPLDGIRTQPSAILAKRARVKVPTLNVGGWYDIFLGDTIANYQAMRALGVPTRLLIGPWSHLGRINPIGERNFGFGSETAFINLEMDFGRLQLRWFDHWLKGIDTGMLAEPAVRIFVMGANSWRDLPDWPPPATPTAFHLRAGGVLSTESPGDEVPDGYEYDPDNPVPTRGGSLLLAPEFPGGPFDQRDIQARGDVLTYMSQPLERDLAVIGPIHLELWATSSAPDTDFVGRLVDVFPDGRAYNLADGIVRARYRGLPSDATASLIEPGRAYRYTVDMWSTSNVFRAGHRIGVQVTSSCFPRWDRNLNTGGPPLAGASGQVAHQQILHDAAHPSHVVLPVVGD